MNGAFNPFTGEPTTYAELENMSRGTVIRPSSSPIDPKGWRAVAMMHMEKITYPPTPPRPPVLSQETDPTGRAQNTPGAKVDAGKNRLGLVLGAFSRSLQAVGQVGTFGAQKYTDNGWISVPDGERRYLDAMLRHTFDEAAGQARDPQTELLHAAHTAWNALARLDLILRRLEQTPTDK